VVTLVAPDGSGCQDNSGFLNMDEDFEKQIKLVQQASGIIAIGEGKVKITEAMKLVGFSTPERAGGKVYQQVRRRSLKVADHVVEASKSDLPLAAVAGTVSDVSSLAGPSSSESVAAGKEPTSFAEGTARRPLLPPGPSAVTVATDLSTKTTTAHKKKGRATSKQVQKTNALKALNKHHNKLAMKQATLLIARNKLLDKNHPEKKTIDVIVKECNKRMNANISATTAAQYVREGRIGISPRKRGPANEFDKPVWTALKGAFVTYIKLEQAESKKQSSIAKLQLLVNGCVNKAGYNKTRDDLTRKLKKETSHLLDVGKANVVDQRRLMWTTAYNLECWFKSWSETLVELGFARKKTIADGDIEGELFFFPGQTHRIGNIDETDGSLDDTTGQRGGRPPMVFFAPDIAGGGTAVNKSGYSATVICGSTAAGDPFPPHFQLKTLAKTDSGQRLSVDWFTHTKNVLGTFGHGRRTSFPCTFGMNEKAGMNAVELEKYMYNSILPLYPDIQDYPGKRVVLKVDSGPGRLNVPMLANLKLQGLYIIPGVPNTTHVTQETDQNYGLYKSCVRENLRRLYQARFDLVPKKAMQVTDLPLIVFGGECPSTKLELRDAFREAFSVARNISCWRKCGAVPLTMAPLFTGQVRQEVPVGAAATVAAASGMSHEAEGIAHLQSLQAMNVWYCDLLNANGFDGTVLRKDAPTRETYVAVTEPVSDARVLAIQKSKTAGQMYFATGGRHTNCNEFFKARELTIREVSLKALTTRKKALALDRDIEAAVVLLLNEKGNPTEETAKNFTVGELKLLLKWKKVKPISNKKADLVTAFMTNPSPINHVAEWTDEEEAKLVALQSTHVDVGETALGVSTIQMSNAVTNNLMLLPLENRLSLKRAIDEMEQLEALANLPDPDGTTGQI
jgi:hypothetical protein